MSRTSSVYRVTLTALTPDAIRAAFAAPRPLDMKLIEAYAAERIVARLVGWTINAAARQALGFKTALTVDGMVALRLLAERDAQTAAFTPGNALAGKRVVRIRWHSIHCQCAERQRHGVGDPHGGTGGTA